MDHQRIITVRLPLVFCLVADFPPDTNIDCSIPSSEIHSTDNFNNYRDHTYDNYYYTSNFNETVYCYECPVPGRFLFGGGTFSDHYSQGHVFTVSLWVLTALTGLFGIFSNIFIIYVLRRKVHQRSFDFLLITLACFDLLTSFTVIISTTATVVLFEGWSVEVTPLILYFVGTFLSVFGRSGSAFMTVLITLERYLVIAHPMKCSTWFTSRRTKLYAVGVAILALLLNIPRFSSVVLRYNENGQDVPSLRGMKWIILPSSLEYFWYYTLKSIHYQIDIWLPFPLLVIFNMLLFVEITKFMKKRQDLSSKQRKDIRAARMFLPVVILLFFCNIEPIIHYIVLHFKKIYYRELTLGFDLSMAMNASVNLPIYYSRGGTFREEIRAALPKWIKFMTLGKANPRNNDNRNGVGQPNERGRKKEENTYNNSVIANTSLNACVCSL